MTRIVFEYRPEGFPDLDFVCTGFDSPAQIVLGSGRKFNDE
jgi:hypothetical protein